jgi:AraC-like DNA-binding protein
MHEPLFQRIHLAENQSYNVLKVDRPYFVVPWHVHPEIEIMLVVQGEGTRFVGDSVERFEPGDLVMVGANLSHVWKNSTRHYEENTGLRAKARVILFGEDCFGPAFFKVPEMQPVQALLQRAERGIVFHGKTRQGVADKIFRAHAQEGIKRFLTFIDILHDLARSREFTLLSSVGYSQSMQADDMSRINKVLDYLMRDFRNPIRLEDIAARANMAPTSFCRYFKSRTNKTVISFVNELRVGYAHKLLIETPHTITDIAYECGFNNVSNFYRQFQTITGRSPLQYRREHEEKLIKT